MIITFLPNTAQRICRYFSLLFYTDFNFTKTGRTHNEPASLTIKRTSPTADFVYYKHLPDIPSEIEQLEKTTKP
jgi:hypothetical protein